MSNGLFAQFYNGLQMAFGKNRVQYENFVWQYYRFPKYDTYYYVGGKELAQYTSIIADAKIREFESFFGYTLEKRIVFLLYNNLSDFRQSNLGLISGNDNYNIGGVTKIIDNKAFLYFEGDHKKLEKQINAAIAEVYVNEMLYGTDLKSKVANNTLLTLPEWFYRGLISYLSNDWDVDIDNKVRDGILTGKFERFNNLTGQDAIYAGHSIWYFISEKFGKKVIPNIVYLTRVSKNSESGFLYVLGLPVKYLTFEWLAFYDARYYEDDKKRDEPTGQTTQVKTRRDRVYQQYFAGPDGSSMAYVTNYSGKYKVFLKDKPDTKPKRIHKGGRRIEQITDYSYPLLAWHPSGKLLTYVTEEKGTIWLSFYDLETRETDKKEMFNVEKIIDYSFNNKGNLMVLSALKNGQTDIFVFNNLANTYQQITNDLADDCNPRFTGDDQTILFSSNRTSDTLGVDSVMPGLNTNYNVFSYNYKTQSKVLVPITYEKSADFLSPYEISENKYMLLGNSNGLWNRYLAVYDSTISHIDTTVHYRFFTHLLPQTNLKRSITEYSYNRSTGMVNQVLYYKGKDIMTEEKSSNRNDLKVTETVFWKKMQRQNFIKDSLMEDRIRKDSMKISTFILTDTIKYDTTNIDFRNYYFEFQKNKLKGYLPLKDSLKAASPGKLFNADAFSKPRLYMTSFYTNYFVSQVDFGFLNNTYQPFTGGAVYFNPGFNVFFKIGTNDLLENYKITGGVRFAGNFDSNEYLLTLEDLKKQVDKEWTFHRMAITSILNNAIVKTHTHELMHVRKYPFNQVFAIRGTVLGRYDRGTYLSTDLSTLRENFDNNYWAGLKGELIYDDTKLVQLNIFNGTRFKIFAEYYKQVNEKKSDMWVVGADFRFYKKIHRNLISASRLGGSTSFGSKKLIYFLGSVDNWINLSPKLPTFDQSIAIDYSRNYAYQTLATNMRGFSQNIRNGNSFVVYNQELRWPFIKYFVNRPINSDFLENMQFVGFFDVGTAWAGKTPYDEANAYNKEVVLNGPVTVIIDKERNPFVYGYGFGLRTRMLGYFVRADWAWGIENAIILPRIFYLSLSLDF
ncbi:MAG: hypothetical protein CVU05_13030 [Bacteroidetes bacterium HGW-Bacteroidetes-21]|nr:MAG: hypothetical protein CVU05_13030 [Bacteroidetes bacterium HGW-Bacteroidetes-21]